MDTAPVPPGHREVGGGARYTLHVHASPGSGSVNTYWVETAHAVLVYDGQRQISEARAALAAIRRLGKPIRAIVVSHEHPDHVGGLDVFVDAADPDAPVWASAETRAGIAADSFGYFALARSLLGDDFPDAPALTTATLSPGQVIDLDGLALRVHEFGAAEAPSMTGLDLGDGQMLVGDVVANGMTPFLLEGRILPWIAQLEACATTLAGVRRVYPGHGDAADRDALVAAQWTYLTGLRDLVREAMGDSPALSPAARDAVADAFERRYPGYLPVAEIPGLVGMNAEAVARELAGAR